MQSSLYITFREAGHHRLSFSCHVGWFTLTIGISCAHDLLMNFFNEKECDYGRGWYRFTHGDFA